MFRDIVLVICLLSVGILGFVNIYQSKEIKNEVKHLQCGR